MYFCRAEQGLDRPCGQCKSHVHKDIQMRLIRNLLIALLPLCGLEAAAEGDTLSYRLELSGNASTGDYAPLWFTANRYGLSSERPQSGYLRAGVQYTTRFGHGWSLQSGLDLAGAIDQTAPFVVQQAYADLSWKVLTLSVGAKERGAFPLEKDMRLSSGMMVEGANARPIPQVRLEMKQYWNVPLTRGWLGLKGHIGYGVLTDGRWRENFVKTGQSFSKRAVYHTKSLMFRVGNEEKFPLTMEIGMLETAQFGGSMWKKQPDGSSIMTANMPNGFKDFLKAIIPIQESTIENIEGNHTGSWNFALNYTAKTWKARVYYEHFFDDHSQLTWQYGRWKDGHIGVEVTLPKNPVVTKVLWEGLCTTDQTGPILYDGVAGSFNDLQMSGGDNYYNHATYPWTHWGQNIGHPFIYGPVYGDDGRLEFHSSRVKAHHIGIGGNPTDELAYRMLLSFTRHWGTYREPLDAVRRQNSMLFELTYAPKRLRGWEFTASCGVDDGNYLGNSVGGMITICKSGLLWTR